MTLDDVAVELTAVAVEVSFPETPFGGVQVFGATDTPIQIILREGAQGKPGPPGPIGADGSSGGIADQGTTPLMAGQTYVDIVLNAPQPDIGWFFVGSIQNLIDSSPLNIWTGIMTAKTVNGCRIQLNGAPDTGNYFLRWAISSGTSVPPVEPIPATTYILSGPSSGLAAVASTNFTVTITPSGGTVTGTVTITPNDGGGGGTFMPTTVSLTTGAPSATFTYTPASSGAKTISTTNDGGLTNPGNLTYTVAAAGLSDGDPVSTWANSASTGATYNATQTGSARPIFKTAIVNGKPVVRFTTAGTSGLNLASSISGNTPFTCFAVMKATGPTVRLVSLGGSDVTSGGFPVGPLENTTGDTYVGDRSGFVHGVCSTTVFHVITGISLHPGCDMFVDGTTPSTTLGSLANTGDFATIGYFALPTPQYSDGDIAEIIMYNVTLSGTDRANVEKYLGTKYGITVAGGSAVDPTTVTGLVGWWKADSGVS